MAEAVKSGAAKSGAKVQQANGEPAAKGDGKDYSYEAQVAAAKAAEKPEESRTDKFRRLANARVPAAIKRIRQIANLANRAQYEHTPEQAGKIIQVLSDELAALKARFAGQKSGGDAGPLF